MKINLGCGKHPIDGWVNYDQDSGQGVTQIDLSKGILPHENNSVDFIFTEHFIEHITKEEAIKLFKECHRVLKPRGVLRISTPDLKKVMRQYLANEILVIPSVWEPQSGCDMVNEGLRMWGHQYVWDGKELERQLNKFGFKVFKVWKSKSIYPELNNLEVRPEYFEMYREAHK